MEGTWSGYIITALGSGAFATLLTIVTNYLLAKRKMQAEEERQPIEQYDRLAEKLAKIIDQERVHFEARLEQERTHCDSRLSRLEAEIDKSCEREQKYIDRELAHVGKIGELEGRLDEMRQMLRTMVNQEKENTTAIALIRGEQAEARG